MLPRSIKVGPHVYKVVHRNSVEMDSNLGDTTHSALLIRLNVSQCAGSRRDTLLHEAMHAVMDAHGLARSFELDDNEQERLIRALTPALLSLIRDNPKLIKYLTR